MTTTTQTSPAQAQWYATNKFLGELFVNSTLAQGYLNICQQANGQPNAPEMLNNWLSSQGYDTTPALVYLALISLQNNCLGCWAGIYGQSFLENNQSAPVLVIGPDKQGNTVPYLNGIALNNYIFQMVGSDNTINPNLSWGLDNNSSAGNITFYYTSPITYDSNPPIGYTGNWFQGTLQTSATSPQQTFYGAIASVSDSSAIPLITPDSSDSDQTPDSSDTDQSFWNKYFLAIVWSVYAVVSLAGLGLVVYLNNRLPNRNFNNNEEKVIENGEETVIKNNEETVYKPIKDVNKIIIDEQNQEIIIMGIDDEGNTFQRSCPLSAVKFPGDGAYNPLVPDTTWNDQLNYFTDGFSDGVLTWTAIGEDGVVAQYYYYPDGKIVKTYLSNDEVPTIATTQDIFRQELGNNLVFETFSPDGTTYEKQTNSELIKQFIDADGDLLQMHYQLDGTVTVTLPKPGEEIKWPEPPVKFIKNDTVPDILISNISEQTGISEAEVSSSLKKIQNNPQQKADWDQLIKEGVDKGYFKNPDQDNDDYQSWLQQVKDTLKEASVPDQPSSVQPQQPESPKATEPSSEPPAPQTQPVPPKENPLAQQEKTGVVQPQAAPVPSEQQPVQGSQAEKIQNASNSLGTETSTPPVQTTSPDVKQTPPDTTKNEPEFDPPEGE